jgi:hypothetical protein
MIWEWLGILAIRYIHFFSSIMWWGMMFFMFVIVFPANKDSRYSTLFPRVQRFMIIVASVAMASGIVLILVNTKFSIETLFGSSWGYTILIGAIISVFVYAHILMQNRKSRKITTSTIVLAPPTSLRKNSKDIINNNKNQRRKIPKRFIPWLLFVLLTITVALMVYASHGFF